MAGEFPTPAFSGPQYLRYYKHPKDYKEFTEQSKFEDGGVDSLETGADVPQRWTLVYGGLTETEAKTLDDYWDLKRLSTKFTFVEPRNAPWTGSGTTYTTSVQFEDYQRPDHEHYNVQARIVKLIKYPA